MIFDTYPYIKVPQQSNIDSTIESLLKDNNKAETYDHVCAVAKQNVMIAKQFGLDEEKCYIAGILHDVSCVIMPNDMLEYAKKHNWNICPAEECYPFLLHQRLSAVVAEEFFGVLDDEILSAIRCHTTLKSQANAYQMALFVADKLAWDQNGTPPFYEAVKLGLTHSLEKASYSYMSYMSGHSRVLFPHEDWILAMEWLEKKK